MAFWQAMMPDDIAEEDGARYIGFTKRREKCDGQIEQKKFSFFTAHKAQTCCKKQRCFSFFGFAREHRVFSAIFLFITSSLNPSAFLTQLPVSGNSAALQWDKDEEKLCE